MDAVAIRKPDTAGMVIAGALLLIALVIFWDASAMQVATTYGMGPQAMPYVIAIGMALLAAGNFLLAWRGDFLARESFDPKAIMLILGGLAALGLAWLPRHWTSPAASIRVASIPLRPGMLRSMSTMSAPSASASITAASPLVTSPTTVTPGASASAARMRAHERMPL